MKVEHHNGISTTVGEPLAAPHGHGHPDERGTAVAGVALIDALHIGWAVSFGDTCCA